MKMYITWSPKNDFVVESIYTTSPYYYMNAF